MRERESTVACRPRKGRGWSERRSRKIIVRRMSSWAPCTPGPIPDTGRPNSTYFCDPNGMSQRLMFLPVFQTPLCWILSVSSLSMASRSSCAYSPPPNSFSRSSADFVVLLLSGHSLSLSRANGDSSLVVRLLAI